MSIYLCVYIYLCILYIDTVLEVVNMISHNYFFNGNKQNVLKLINNAENTH